LNCTFGLSESRPNTLAAAEAKSLSLLLQGLTSDRGKTLQPYYSVAFNSGMTPKTLIQIIDATVIGLTPSEITLKCDGDTWIVKRTQTTNVIGGILKVGSTVSIQCKSPDCQHKEAK
jgi:hypothetical protein